METKKRLIGLDYIRVLAFTSVMFYHFFFIGPLEDMAYKRELLIKNAFWGYYGVDIFFLLSGYLVLKSAKKRSAKEFFLSRIIRIYPTFIVCSGIVLMSLIIGACGVSTWQNYLNAFIELSKTWIMSLTLSTDLFNISPLSAIYWTLIVEMRFYMWVTLVKVTKKWESNKYKILFIWLVFAAVERWIFPCDLIEKILLLKYAGHFSLGILLSMDNRKDNMNLVLKIFSVALIFYTLIDYRDWIFNAYGLLFDATYVLIYLFFIITMFAFSSKCGEKENSIFNKVIEVLSESSFTFYLIHADLIGFMLNVLLPNIGGVANYIFVYHYKYCVMICILIILLFSILLTKVINSLIRNLFVNKELMIRQNSL